jgi:hypothetical protein
MRANKLPVLVDAIGEKEPFPGQYALRSINIQKFLGQFPKLASFDIACGIKMFRDRGNLHMLLNLNSLYFLSKSAHEQLTIWQTTKRFLKARLG